MIILIINAGINFRIFFDFDTKSLSGEITLLNGFIALKLRVFEWSQKLFYQINKGNIYELDLDSFKQKTEKESHHTAQKEQQKSNKTNQNEYSNQSKKHGKKSKKKLQNIPTIKPYAFKLNVLIGHDDALKLAGIYATSCMLTGIIQGVMDRYISPKNREIKFFQTTTSQTLKINAVLILKLEIFKIFFQILRIIINKDNKSNKDVQKSKGKQSKNTKEYKTV